MKKTIIFSSLSYKKKGYNGVLEATLCVAFCIAALFTPACKSDKNKLRFSYLTKFFQKYSELKGRKKTEYFELNKIFTF